MIETILEIITMCSLTQFAPYYDCDNTWEIWLVEEDYPYCSNESLACIWYNQKELGNHIIKIPQSRLDYVNPQGEGILWHELRHGICECRLGEK